jgi:hypothetical protein
MRIARSRSSGGYRRWKGLFELAILAPSFQRTAASSKPRAAHTEKIKRDQMAAYGLQGQRLGEYELDHLIPLELGGAPQEVANLWPEPWERRRERAH